MKTLSRLLRTPALHEVPVPIGLDAEAMPGARVLGNDGAVYTSIRYPTPESPYTWTSASSLLASGAVPLFFEPGFNVTVGTTGADYTSLSDALGDLLLYVNNNITELPPASILIKSGFTVEDRINTIGLDLSWVLIQSEDDWVPVDAGAITADVTAPFTSFMSFRNGASPIIDCGFELVGTRNPLVTTITGISNNGSRFYTLTTNATKPRGVKGFDIGTGMGANSTARLHDWQSIDCTQLGVFVQGGSYANLINNCVMYSQDVSLLCSSLSTVLAFSSTIDYTRDGTPRPTDVVVEANGVIRVASNAAVDSLCQSPNIDTPDGIIYHSAQPYPYGKGVEIADDAVALLRPPRLGGLLYVTAENSGTFNGSYSGMIAYTCGPALTAAKIDPAGAAGSLDASVINLTGTTGVDGKVTVSAQADKIQIENRSGSTRTFYASWL